MRRAEEISFIKAKKITDFGQMRRSVCGRRERAECRGELEAKCMPDLDAAQFPFKLPALALIHAQLTLISIDNSWEIDDRIRRSSSNSK
jgi:hypothetical protein